MDVDEAAALIAPGLAGTGGAWADLGAGRGTFASALAGLLGSEGRVWAVDRDPAALSALARLAEIVPGGVAPPVRIGERRSVFGGVMYVASAVRGRGVPDGEPRGSLG